MKTVILLLLTSTLLCACVTIEIRPQMQECDVVVSADKPGEVSDANDNL